MLRDCGGTVPAGEAVRPQSCPTDLDATMKPIPSHASTAIWQEHTMAFDQAPAAALPPPNGTPPTAPAAHSARDAISAVAPGLPVRDDQAGAGH